MNCPHPDPCARRTRHTVAQCVCSCGSLLRTHPPIPKLPWGRVSIQADLGRSTWRTFTPKRKR